MSEQTTLIPQSGYETIRAAMASVRLKQQASKERSHTGKRAPKFAPAGQSTQMIVGADDASDRVILSTASTLYGSYQLKRVYYSAFSPIPDSSDALPLQPAPLLREHRLYQADWLIRFYGFAGNELTQDDPQGDASGGMLDLTMDPKLSWAVRNPAFFPVDINYAPKSALLRVPGLGPVTVNKIIQCRRFNQLRYSELSKLRKILIMFCKMLLLLILRTLKSNEKSLQKSIHSFSVHCCCRNKGFKKSG